jgi:adhesin transport system outer membrane protein
MTNGLHNRINIQMQKSYRWLPGLILVSLCVAVQGQTLKEAAQQAILTNPEVLARWHSFLAANGERAVAAGAFLPRLDVTAGVGRDRYDDPTLGSNLNRNSTTLTLTQLIYDGFATSNDVKRLDYARRVRLFELHDVTESMLLEVVRAYFDVIRYRELVVLAEENYVRHRSVFDQIQRKTAAGVGRRVDLEQVSGRLALAESNLLTETSNLHDVSARFQRLVGSAPRQNMEMTSTLSKDMPADMTTALKAATRLHPALQAATENVRSADSSAKVRNGAFQPRFDLRIRSENGNNIGGIAGNNRNQIAEIVVSWNLFNGMSDISRVRQYAEQLNVARDQRDKICLDLRQTLAIAYNDTRKLTEQLTYLDQHQLAIEKARDAYRKQFDIGQRTLLDVLDTENELFQAKRAYTNAEYDLQIAYARTHAGIGTLFLVLGLTRLATEPLPNLGNEGADSAERCPPEVTTVYTTDKAALNARAQQLLKESMPAIQDAGPAPAQPASALPLPRTESVPPAIITASSENAVAQALKAWSSAWSSRNVQAYLDTYSPTFKPFSGISHDAWVVQRKAVIAAAKQIDLDITKVQIKMENPERIVTTFTQSYRSASYQDVVEKTLKWANIAGRWLIVSESTNAPAKN